MRKAILILVMVFWCNVTFASSIGKGEVKLSLNIVDYFIQYIKTPGKHPFVFILADDGSWATYYYCSKGTGACEDRGGVQQGIKRCERKSNTKCGVFARRRTVVWKNGINKGGKQGAIKSRWSDTEIEAKLTELGFLGYTTQTTTSSVKSESQKKAEKKEEEKKLREAKKAEKKRIREAKKAEKKRLKEAKKAAAKEREKKDSEDRDVLKEIKELNELYQQGVLTDEEFTKAKSKILK